MLQRRNVDIGKKDIKETTNSKNEELDFSQLEAMLAKSNVFNYNETSSLDESEQRRNVKNTKSTIETKSNLSNLFTVNKRMK